MKLISLGYRNLEDFQDFEIEEGILQPIATRMVEDLDVVVYTFAISHDFNSIYPDIVGRSLQVITQSSKMQEYIPYVSFDDAPVEAFVTIRMVQELIRAPIEYDYESYMLIAKFTNFQLNNMILFGARQASREGSRTLTLFNLLDFCKYLPYPLDRICEALK